MREEDKSRRPSEVINDFLDYLYWAKEEQEKAWDIVTTEDDKTQDYLHKLEFCNDCGERSRIATEWHKSRVKRRAAKDKAKEYSEIYKFLADTKNKWVINAIKKLAGDQRHEEDYVRSERKYTNRVLKEGDGNSDNT